MRAVWLTVGVAALLNIATWGVSLFWFPYSGSAAVLHYTSGVGIDAIGAGNQIMVMPLAGTLLALGNTWLGYSLKKISPRASWLLWITVPVIQAMLLITVIFIGHLNV